MHFLGMHACYSDHLDDVIGVFLPPVSDSAPVCAILAADGLAAQI